MRKSSNLLLVSENLKEFFGAIKLQGELKQTQNFRINASVDEEVVSEETYLGSRLHIVRDIQHIKNVYLVFYVQS